MLCAFFARSAYESCVGGLGKAICVNGDEAMVCECAISAMASQKLYGKRTGKDDESDWIQDRIDLGLAMI